MFHGGLSPESFYLTGGCYRKEDETGSFSMVDAGWYYYLDKENSKVMFIQNFCSNNENFFYAAPELRAAYCEPTSN